MGPARSVTAWRGPVMRVGGDDDTGAHLSLKPTAGRVMLWRVDARTAVTPMGVPPRLMQARVTDGARFVGHGLSATAGDEPALVVVDLSAGSGQK